MSRGRISQILNIEDVSTRFAQWRQTRQGKARIPDELWSAAVDVARRDGVNRTAAALHLDGGKLKRMMMTSHARRSKTLPPAFVELIATNRGSQPEYTIEVERDHGKLRIYCKGASAAELAALTRALLGVTS